MVDLVQFVLAVGYWGIDYLSEINHYHPSGLGTSTGTITQGSADLYRFGNVPTNLKGSFSLFFKMQICAVLTATWLLEELHMPFSLFVLGSSWCGAQGEATQQVWSIELKGAFIVFWLIW